MTIGKIICELRKERNISQQKLADAIGVNQATIAKIEVNRNEATAATIRKLSTFFDVSADYLLGLEDDFGTRVPAEASSVKPLPPLMQQYADEERQLVEEYRKLPRSSQELVLRMVGITEKTST